MRAKLLHGGRFAGIVLSLAGQLRLPAADELPPLNDAATAVQLSGKFVWADLFATDPGAAAKFYTGLFGWQPTTLARDGHSYILFHRDGRAIAGIVQRPAPRGAPRPSRWVSYVAVADVARALTLVTGAGGKVLAPAREFPRRGVQAIVSDNEDAVIGLLHSSSGDPEDFRAENGDWIWAELFVVEPAAAATFYQRVFGYEVKSDTADEPKGWLVLTAGGYARAGIGPLPVRPDAQPAWLGFVRVADADAAAARATELGGRVLVAPRMSHLGSRFAVVADPTGAAIAVTDYNTPTGRESTP